MMTRRWVTLRPTLTPDLINGVHAMCMNVHKAGVVVEDYMCIVHTCIAGLYRGRGEGGEDMIMI